jgi:hypothetical protein
MSAISGISGSYNSEAPIRTLYSNNIISPVAGVNPADSGYVKLNNTRGQINVSITSGDNSYTSSFNITGGFGKFSTDSTQNWYPETHSANGCVVTVPVLNTIRIETPIADAGGRVYFMQFFPVQGVAPQIRQTSVNIIGNNILTVKLIKKYIGSYW